MISIEELNRLKEACEKATPGPWASQLKQRVVVDPRLPFLNPDKPDIEFMVLSREAMPQLIAEVERLMELNTTVSALAAQQAQMADKWKTCAKNLEEELEAEKMISRMNATAMNGFAKERDAWKQRAEKLAEAVDRCTSDMKLVELGSEGHGLAVNLILNKALADYRASLEGK